MKRQNHISLGCNEDVTHEQATSYMRHHHIMSHAQVQAVYRLKRKARIVMSIYGDEAARMFILNDVRKLAHRIDNE
jgi:hypothetical protein